MANPRQPIRTLDSGSMNISDLPPTLRVNPIREASAPVNHLTNGLASTLASIALFSGGYLLIEFGQQLQPPALKVSGQTVRLLLDDFSLAEAPGGGGMGSGIHAPQTDPSAKPLTPSPDPFALRIDELRSFQETVVPLEVSKEFPELQSVQVPPLSGSSMGNGIGRGVGTGMGNGIGSGTGRGRGSTWIHSATGGEGMQVQSEGIDVKDYIPPDYPLAAKVAKIAGDVVIEVTIDQAGRPTGWKVLDGHPSLAEASLVVLPRWRFIPIRYKGQKVSATFEVRIRFTLL